VANNPETRFTVLDLFSGIGGFALATEWAGGRTLAFAETAEYPSTVLKHHWPHTPNLGDIKEICPYEFAKTYGVPDVITAGVPCQPTSCVGKQRGTTDERWLWPDTLRLIGGLQPGYAILENPKALLNLENGQPFQHIVKELSSFGYDLFWDVIPASALGAGHKRERLWILATHADLKRLERHPRNAQTNGNPQTYRHITKEDLRTRTITCPLWYHQSNIQPVVNGLPTQLVKNQLIAIGNTLVPQIAYLWLTSIATDMTHE
jgi:DNA (cytosine-5)-methyltransferase 1